MIRAKFLPIVRNHLFRRIEIASAQKSKAPSQKQEKQSRLRNHRINEMLVWRRFDVPENIELVAVGMASELANVKVVFSEYTCTLMDGILMVGSELGCNN